MKPFKFSFLYKFSALCFYVMFLILMPVSLSTENGFEVNQELILCPNLLSFSSSLWLEHGRRETTRGRRRRKSRKLRRARKLKQLHRPAVPVRISRFSFDNFLWCAFYYIPELFNTTAFWRRHSIPSFGWVCDEISISKGFPKGFYAVAQEMWIYIWAISVSYQKAAFHTCKRI